MSLNKLINFRNNPAAFTCLKSARETTQCTSNTSIKKKKRHWRCYGVFIVHIEQISHIVLISVDLVVKSKLTPRSGSNLEAVEPHT